MAHKEKLPVLLKKLEVKNKFLFFFKMVMRLRTKDEQIYQGLYSLKTNSFGVLPKNKYSVRILNNINQNNQNIFFEQKGNQFVVRKQSNFKFNLLKL